MVGQRPDDPGQLPRHYRNTLCPYANEEYEVVVKIYSLERRQWAACIATDMNLTDVVDIGIDVHGTGERDDLDDFLQLNIPEQDVAVLRCDSQDGVLKPKSPGRARAGERCKELKRASAVHLIAQPALPPDLKVAMSNAVKDEVAPVKLGVRKVSSHATVKPPEHLPRPNVHHPDPTPLTRGDEHLFLGAAGA